MTDRLIVIAAAEFGNFISWWKILPFLVLFLVWAKLLTWVDKDTIAAFLPRSAINGGMFAGFALATLLFFSLPGLVLSLLAFITIFAIEIGTYLFIRSQKVGLADLGPELKKAFTINAFSSFGKSKDVQTSAGEVGLFTKSGAVVPPDVQDPARIGYDALQVVLYEPLVKEAHTIDIVPNVGGAMMRYHVDGVVYDGANFEKQPIADAIAFLKQTAGLDPAERRKVQTGKFKASVGPGKKELVVSVSGSSQGEAATIEIDIAKRYQYDAGDLGLSSEQLEELRSVRENPGLVVLAAPKGQGLTTLQYGVLRIHDAFVYRVMTVERDPPIDLESITQNKLPGGASQAEEQKLVSWVCSQEPDVVLASGIESGQSARDLAAYAQKHRAYVSVRANDVFEALSIWVKLSGSSGLAAVTHVVAGRTFRKLCDATKIPYLPDERLLKQLGVTPGKVNELYKPSVGPILDAKGNEIPDEFCHGLGYKGRIGVYEMLAVDDEVKQIMKTGGNVASLRQVFRKQKRRYLQEMALQRVLTGETSVQEMLRILKPESGSERPSSKSAVVAKG